MNSIGGKRLRDRPPAPACVLRVHAWRLKIARHVNALAQHNIMHRHPAIPCKAIVVKMLKGTKKTWH